MRHVDKSSFFDINYVGYQMVVKPLALLGRYFTHRERATPSLKLDQDLPGDPKLHGA